MSARSSLKASDMLHSVDRRSFSSPEEFEKACHHHHHHISRKGAHMFLVGVDGSDQSEAAFQSAMNLRGKYDHICVFHAFRGDKPDLQPATWRPKQLEMKYDVELIGRVPKNMHSLCFKDRQGQQASEVLKDVLRSTQSDHPEILQTPDFLVMGYHGRKGSKATMGSTTDAALRSLPFPCLVVKALVPKTPRKVYMAVNDTEVSKRGLDILLSLINPRDSLTLLHFAPADTRGSAAERMEAYYRTELEEFGPPDSKFQFIDRDRAIPVTHAVVEFVNDSDCDLFAIAPRAKQDRSAVSDYILTNVLCSVLLCKC